MNGEPVKLGVSAKDYAPRPESAKSPDDGRAGTWVGGGFPSSLSPRPKLRIIPATSDTNCAQRAAFPDRNGVISSRCSDRSRLPTLCPPKLLRLVQTGTIDRPGPRAESLYILNLASPGGFEPPLPP